jgi:phage replication-related protein YjqB (UPF0714/DUF867 family)
MLFEEELSIKEVSRLELVVSFHAQNEKNKTKKRGSKYK